MIETKWDIARNGINGWYQMCWLIVDGEEIDFHTYQFDGREDEEWPYSEVEERLLDKNGYHDQPYKRIWPY